MAQASYKPRLLDYQTTEGVNEEGAAGAKQAGTPRSISAPLAGLSALWTLLGPLSDDRRRRPWGPALRIQ